ncbi:MAG: DUF1439 domain-containing protein [Candidatus Handelsmanbacteria bacterium]|nr:DUF1439 domain-containing protein [Candidatus Handelsmanbacteria bacterium]
MRRVALWLLLLILAGCAGPFQLGVSVPRQKLQQRLDTHFPFETKVLLFAVSFSSPMLTLEPGADRVGLHLALEAGMPGVQYKGEVALDSGLAYQARTGSLVLVGPRLFRFQLEDMPEIFCRQVEKVVGPLVTAHLDSLPVYQLKEGQARRRLKGLRIEKDQVVTVLGL